MKQILSVIILLTFISSCQSILSEDSHASDIRNKTVYMLRLTPQPGSTYHYAIENVTTMKFEVDDKETVNENKSAAGILNKVSRDTAGNLVFAIQYEKIHIHTKNDGAEADYDGTKSGFSFDPIEKMLGVLQANELKVNISPNGDVKSIDGYQEMTNSFISLMNPQTEADKDAVQKKWEQLIKEGLVTRNIDQLFKVFPDSAVHIHDKWNLTTKQKGDLEMNFNTTYFLKNVDEDVALIESSSEISSDSLTSSFGGYDASAHLKGDQFGEIRLETKTGMLLSAKLIAKIEGTIEVMDKEIPIHITTAVTINGKRQ